MAVTYTAGYAAAATQPMKHARILWSRLTGTVTATSAADGFAAANAATIDTASWWQPVSAPASWTITFAGARTVDAVGIAAHRLTGATVTIAALVSGSWVDVVTLTPTDNSAILALFAAVSCTAVRVTTSIVARIGVIYAGQALAMARPGYTALGLADLGRQAVLTSYVSEGGQLLARYIQRRGLAASYEWEHLTEAWYRANFDAFAVSAQTEPFFIAARPQDVPTDCVYGWVDEPITPARMGIRDLMSVGFSLMGHADA